MGAVLERRMNGRHTQTDGRELYQALSGRLRPMRSEWEGFELAASGPGASEREPGTSSM